MAPQLFLGCFSRGVLHTGFDVHIKLSPEMSCTLPIECGNFPSHLVQALFVDFLGLGGGEGGATIFLSYSISSYTALKILSLLLLATGIAKTTDGSGDDDDYDDNDDDGDDDDGICLRTCKNP